jgi:lipopolysaccharide transport system ATP-binding protein
VEKARERLETMVRGADILVVCSHVAPAVQEWCTRLIWLDQGRIKADRLAGEALERYLGRPLPARATGEALNAVLFAARA